MANCGHDLNYFTFLVQVQARQQTVQNFPLSITGLKVEAFCTDVTGSSRVGWDAVNGEANFKMQLDIVQKYFRRKCFCIAEITWLYFPLHPTRLALNYLKPCERSTAQSLRVGFALFIFRRVDTFGCYCMLHYRENLKMNANVSNPKFSLSKTALTQGTD